MGKVVAFVSITHNNVLAPGCQDASHQGIAISLLVDIDQSRAQTMGYFLGAVGATIVSYHDFSRDVVVKQGLLSLLDTSSKGLGLIQTGHYYGQLQACCDILGISVIDNGHGNLSTAARNGGDLRKSICRSRCRAHFTLRRCLMLGDR